MLFRTANLADIPQIQIVRHSVRENTLSDPALVTDQDVAIFLSERGKGWVCEFEGQVIGFAIVDLQDHNIWALFLRPEFEKQGIGRRLQELMLDWYFEQTRETLWLGTAPGTRARVSDHQYRLGRAPIPSFVISFPLLASSLGVYGMFDNVSRIAAFPNIPYSLGGDASERLT